jgi:hypothetical protein
MEIDSSDDTSDTENTEHDTVHKHKKTKPKHTTQCIYKKVHATKTN